MTGGIVGEDLVQAGWVHHSVKQLRLGKPRVLSKRTKGY